MAPPKIECPNCHTNDRLQVLEGATHSWNVSVEDDMLVNHGGYECTDAPGFNERMFCGNCETEFPMIPDVKVDYQP